ncbi:MAG: ferrous iron transport protein A [Nitrospirae bacterium]|nr:ferrous iron transport protein A [Nitrospirota bacterium]
MLPLGLLHAGEKAEVVKIFSGEQYGKCHAVEKSNEQICIRIEDIGLRIGKAIEMLNNKGRGPLLVKVDEARIAIGRGMAMKIMVRRKE